MCRFSLDEATTRSQSLRLFFFKYFLVRYFRYLGKKKKTRNSEAARKAIDDPGTQLMIKTKFLRTGIDYLRKVGIQIRVCNNVKQILNNGQPKNTAGKKFSVVLKQSAN